jgi:O-antigen/teichoic acid export membrane protein
LTTLMAVPITIGTIAYAGDVISLFYGARSYEPSVILLQVLSVGLIFLYVNMVVGTTLLATDRQSAMMILALALIPVNVILNFFMIPYFQGHYENGAIGAAIATTITESVYTVIALKLLPKGILSGFRLSILPKGFAAGAVMVAVLWVLGMSTLYWAVSLAAGCLVYVVMLIVVKTLEPEEEAFLKEVLVRQTMKRLRHSAEE